ncbi:MAG TPA: T9SS type A sorting domain-containing protein [Chitinophagales bacterium]|nr:T9SS type A sorting domain-containing protein [Chitinophagales bacterium]
MKYASIFIACCISLPLKMIAQTCNGRYQNEIFTSFTKTTVEYSDVYNDPDEPSDFLKMDIYQPNGDTFPKRPAVIMAHGGTFIAGSKEETTCADICEMLAKRGYVTASINYRLANSQVELFDSINALRIALRAVSDMKAAVRFFRKDAATDNAFRIDTEQIFVGGNSAGAVTALHVAYVDDTTELPSYIKPLVAAMGGIDGNSGNPGYSSEVSGVINLAGGINKVYWIQPDDVPMVSCHGDNDQTVPYDCNDVLYPDNALFDLIDLCGSGAMKTWCDQVGTDNILHTYPGDGHVPWESNAAKRQSMLQYVADFMSTYTECDSQATGGTREPASELRVAVYPNPSKNLLTLVIEEPLQSATASIFDNAGKQVATSVLDGRAVKNLDISPLPAGHYFLRISSEPGKIYNTVISKVND